MGGIFSKPSPPAPDPSIAAAQQRQEARAEAQTQQEQAKAAAAQRVRRTGGIRMLMSPERLAAQDKTKTKLGSGV